MLICPDETGFSTAFCPPQIETAISVLLKSQSPSNASRNLITNYQPQPQRRYFCKKQNDIADAWARAEVG
jgi:hypothetical protein